MPNPDQILGGNTVQKRWLFLGDGFLDTTEDAEAFKKACASVVGAVTGSAWYPRIPVGALGIWRYDKPTDPSLPRVGHQPDSQVCGEHKPPYSQDLPHSRFKAQFRDDAGPCRQLGGYDEAVLEERTEARKAIGLSKYKGFNRILVLVNTKLYGGSAKSNVAWCALHPSYPLTALHELGHTFELNDEYENTCGIKDSGTAIPLRDFNIGGNPADLPWSPGVSVPVAEKANNSTCHAYRPVPPAAQAWEGGYDRHKGYFRPAKTCRMRDSKKEFCEVCQTIIISALTP